MMSFKHQNKKYNYTFFTNKTSIDIIYNITSRYFNDDISYIYNIIYEAKNFD